MIGASTCNLGDHPRLAGFSETTLYLIALDVDDPIIADWRFDTIAAIDIGRAGTITVTRGDATSMVLERASKDFGLGLVSAFRAMTE